MSFGESWPTYLSSDDLESFVSSHFGFDPRHATYFLGKEDPRHATYFLGKETVLTTEMPGMRLWRERLFVFMHRNATSAAESFALPPEDTVEVGVQVPI